MTEHIEQGSEKWKKKRCGKVTASRFKDVMTKPRSGGGLSQTAKNYALDKVVEIILGQPQETPETWAMQWGTEHEPEARAYYAYAKRCEKEISTTDFVEFDDNPMIGGSPDGLIGTDGIVEIKCPANTRIHLEYMLGKDVPKEHVAQVQGLLWITNRDWCDFVSYDPRFGTWNELEGRHDFTKDQYKVALFIHRVERDEAYIEQLAESVFSFCDHVNELLERIRK